MKDRKIYRYNHFAEDRSKVREEEITVGGRNYIVVEHQKRLTNCFY